MIWEHVISIEIVLRATISTSYNTGLEGVAKTNNDQVQRRSMQLI